MYVGFSFGCVIRLTTPQPWLKMAKDEMFSMSVDRVMHYPAVWASKPPRGDVRWLVEVVSELPSRLNGATALRATIDIGSFLVQPRNGVDSVWVGAVRLDEMPLQTFNRLGNAVTNRAYKSWVNIASGRCRCGSLRCG